MNTNSSHIILDLWMEEEWRDEWVQQIKTLIDESFRVVGRHSHLFEPHGETVAFILSESHFALHSYPEENYISLDVYICKEDYDFTALVGKLEAILPIKNIHQRQLRRGEYALSVVDRLKSSEKGLVVATFLVAACSLFYELMLAQTLSAILGDTVHRYNVTIGLYIASMGVGALVYEKLKIEHHLRALIKIEVILALIGGLAPILSLYWDYLLRDGGVFSTSMISIGLHSLIIIIGFLSGLELPLLMDIGEENRKGFGTKILAVDYLGTLSAAVLFPLVLLPLLPIFSISGIIASINLVVAVGLIIAHSRKSFGLGKIWIVSAIVLLVASVGSVYYSEIIETMTVNKFYLGSNSEN